MTPVMRNRLSHINLNGRKCVLAGLFSAKEKDYTRKLDLAEDRIRELGGCVVSRIVQRRGVSRSKTPGGSTRLGLPLNARTLFSSGKVEELVELVESSDTDIVVFYNSLNENQRSSIKEIAGCDTISYIDDLKIS